MLPVLSATCVNLIALGVIMPVLPFYVTGLGAGPDMAAWVFSVFSGASLLASPYWGRLSDRIGRKPVMLVSVACTCASYLWLAHAGALWEIFAARCFAGATSGWLVASQGLITDVTTEDNRAKGLGMLGAAFGVGFLIGPAITYGLLGGGTDHAVPALFCAGCTAVGFLITLVMVREPERHESRATSHFTFAMFREPSLGRLLIVYFFINLAFTALEGTFALWARETFGYGPRQVAAYFVFIGMIVVIVQGGLIGRIIRQFGEARSAFLGVAMLACGLGLLPLAVTPWLVLAPLFLVVGGYSVIGPATQSLMTKVAPPDLKGGVMGFAQSCYSAARIGGPLWAGFVFVHGGPGWPYVIAAVALVPVALAVRPLFRQPAPAE
jgi:DHA1 family tetracycline resistance protein-like MFS transporter